MSDIQSLPKGHKYLFKSRMGSMSYILKDGASAVFIRGEYKTDVPSQIAELAKEVDDGHPMIYIDANEVTVSPDRDDPIATLRKRIAQEERARILEEMAAATNPARDMGTSEQGKLNAASTSDIAPVAAGGDATARLTAIKASIAQVTSVQTPSA